MSNLLTRVLMSVVVGLVTGFVVALIVLVISALLPGVRIDASFWGGVFGILGGLVYFFSGKTLA